MVNDRYGGGERFRGLPTTVCSAPNTGRLKSAGQKIKSFCPSGRFSQACLPAADPKGTQARWESGRSTHSRANAVANDVVVVPVFPAVPPNQAKNGAGKIIRTLDQTSRQQAPLQGVR
jgi:hypothetical protein